MALTAARKMVRLGQGFPGKSIGLGVKAATTIYGGALVVEDAGVAAPGRTALSLTALGIATDTYDNAAGAASAITCDIESGTFAFLNSAAADAIAAADIGALCYIVDDQTVAKTDGTGTRSIAGRIVKVDSTLGVFVAVGPGEV